MNAVVPWSRLLSLVESHFIRRRGTVGVRSAWRSCCGLTSYSRGSICLTPAWNMRSTTEAMAGIGALYGIEEEIRGKPADLRRSVRQACAKPLLDDLHRWMEKTLGLLSTKSRTAGAIRYALSRWRALTHYVDDGLLEIDDNAAQRSLRSVVMGRNYV